MRFELYIGEEEDYSEDKGVGTVWEKETKGVNGGSDL